MSSPFLVSKCVLFLINIPKRMFNLSNSTSQMDRGSFTSRAYDRKKRELMKLGEGKAFAKRKARIAYKRAAEECDLRYKEAPNLD